MSIQAKILTNIDIPQEIVVEINDTTAGKTELVNVNFEACLKELGSLGSVDLEEITPEQLISMAFALAKHHAIDRYLVSIGIDPHAHLREQGALLDEDIG